MNREHVDSCTSVMDIAKKFIDQPHMHALLPTVVTADKQTRGRGRGGHTWWSPDGNGLYAAFVTKRPAESVYDHFLTMWLGTAIVRVLRNYTLLAIEQRGINDIYLNNRKLGGILCEIYKDHLMVGIGLNTFRPAKVRKDLEETAIWLNEYSAEHLLARADLLKVLEEAIVR